MKRGNMELFLRLILTIAIQVGCLATDGVSASTAHPSAASDTEAVDTSKTIVVLGTSLALKEEKRTVDEYLAEYIPESETFDNFTTMFAVWGRLDGSDAQLQVKAKVQFVNSRKKTDPVANFTLFQSEDKKMLGLDFLISEGGALEHDVWTFQDVRGGVLAYQYARRHYDHQAEPTQSGADFIREIPTIRNRVLEFFKRAQLPRPQGYR